MLWWAGMAGRSTERQGHSAPIEGWCVARQPMQLIRSAQGNRASLSTASAHISIEKNLLRVPAQAAVHSDVKPATCSDLKPAGVPG